MAISEGVKTDFYLTLDVDVICLKAVSFFNLIQKDRAIAMTTLGDWHPDWYK
jgi:hypothetical protein